MGDQIVAIRLDAVLGLLDQMIGHALVDVPIGRIDCNVAYAIPAFFQQAAETVALIGGLAFFQKRIAEQHSFVVIRRDDFFVFQEINGKIGVADARVAIVLVGVRVI